MAQLNLITEVLGNPEAQKLLTTFYASSQAEHIRNGKLSMEIGNSREKDLIAVLVHYLGDKLKYKIDNDLTEDFQVEDRRVSVKHITVKSKTRDVEGVCKCKWTADADKADLYIKEMLECKPEMFTDILLGFIAPERKTITYVLVAAETVMEGVGVLKEKAFVSRKGTNNRGVEFSKEMMLYMCEHAHSRTTIRGVDLSETLDPIQRRLLMISSMLAPSAPRGSPAEEEPHSRSDDSLP